jgi:hypothetical protein
MYHRRKVEKCLDTNANCANLTIKIYFLASPTKQDLPCHPASASSTPATNGNLHLAHPQSTRPTSNPKTMHLSNHFFTPLLLLLLPTLTPSLSTPHTISIPSSHHLPNPAALPPSTTATLTTLAHTYSSHLSTSHTFRFRNVSAPGSYLFSISCATHFFAPLRVDVAADGGVEAWRTFRGNEWGNKGEEVAVVVGEGGVAGDKVLEVRALGGKAYYMERQGCECSFNFLFVSFCNCLRVAWATDG